MSADHDAKRKMYRRKDERRAAKAGVTTRHDDKNYEPRRIRNARRARKVAENNGR